MARQSKSPGLAISILLKRLQRLRARAKETRRYTGQTRAGQYCIATLIKGSVEIMSLKTYLNPFIALALLALSTVSLAAATAAAPAGLEKATFAGGCFWCMETPFRGLAGVSSVASGYIGGNVVDATYEQVSDGGTGHAEAVEIVFDPKKISYAKLLEIFWANIDPTVDDQQFCDQGDQYRSAVFTHTPEQASAAAASKSKWQSDKRFAGRTIYTEINPASAFYAAEEYHQNYAQKNPSRYKYYRWSCGRDQRLEKIWGIAPAH